MGIIPSLGGGNGVKHTRAMAEEDESGYGVLVALIDVLYILVGRAHTQRTGQLRNRCLAMADTATVLPTTALH